MGNCQDICAKTTVQKEFTDHFMPTHIQIPCQLCKDAFNEIKFKEHLDQVHYCFIVEKQSGNTTGQCLFCQFNFENLQEQAAHLKQKHPYAFKQVKSQKNKSVILQDLQAVKKRGYIELNVDKKGNVKKISEQQFNILKTEDDVILASISNQVYECKIKIKQYPGLYFKEEQVEAELVWFNIFSEQRKCKYYFLDEQPKERTILCKAYLFIPQQN